MKGKHLKQRVEACLSLSALSPCPRRSFGCMLLDPSRNVVISEGYNGTLRGSKAALCGGAVCSREGIESGTNLEVGCVHAEQNAIYNAARRGVSVEGSWAFINGEPCEMCAKAMVQVGVSRVFCINGGYTTKNGVEVLRQAKVPVHKVGEDTDYDELMNTVLDSMVAWHLPTKVHNPALTPFSRS